MIIVFRNETHNVKLLSVSTLIMSFFAYGTWMCCERGEGEEEVENQGRSRVKVSSQGTDLKGQWSLRMRANEANQKETVKQEIVKQLSTGCTTDSNSTPHFSSFIASFHKSRSASLLGRRRTRSTLSSVAPRISSISETTSSFVFTCLRFALRSFAGWFSSKTRFSGWFALQTSLCSFALQTSDCSFAFANFVGSSFALATTSGNFYA